MIRIYFDWNIITNLKTQEYKNILDFISSHKNTILAPYSQAHFTDLMKSYHPKNKYFEQDLKMLDLICDKYLLSRGKDGVEPSFAITQ